MKGNRKIHILYVFVVSLLMTSCYYPNHSQRHYTTNFNFLVVRDSIAIQDERPLHNQEFAPVPDTLYLQKGNQIVVAQIAVIPEDSIDSVWVKVARDQMTQGWIHEKDLLPNVVPDDPISQFINLFSQRHLWYFVGLILLAMAVVLVNIRHKRSFYIVHFNDLPTIYPTLLCLTLVGSALLYASIQRYVPETWIHFYYHPTLNPFGLPYILGLFLVSVWLLIILMIATVDEVRKLLPSNEIALYLLSLMAILMFEYLIFSLAAFSVLGYILYVLYAAWALYRYFRYYYPRYICGNCGCKMHDLGKCPHCGAINSETK